MPARRKTDPEEKGGGGTHTDAGGEGGRRRGCWSLKFEVCRRTLHELREPAREREII